MKNAAGVFPTMITPYLRDGTVDYGGIKKLAEWYDVKGCEGIFAVCQSSEMFYLSLEERIKISRTVVEAAKEIARRKNKKPMKIVASGHISDAFEDQVRELLGIVSSGVDAVVLVSNRMDIQNTSEEKWIEDMRKLAERLPPEVELGIYECPRPYKRLLTRKMIKALVQTQRFTFIKDTCCDADTVKERLDILRGGGVRLYNANTQTLLETVKYGAEGYCGVMANFFPETYAALFRCLHTERENLIQSFLCLSAFTETLSYPTTAKYYLKEYEGIDIAPISRAVDCELLSGYEKSCLRQMKYLNDHIMSEIEKEGNE